MKDMKLKQIVNIVVIMAVSVISAQAQPDLPVKLIDGTR